LNFHKRPTFVRADIHATFYHGYDILARRFQIQNVGFSKKNCEKSGALLEKWAITFLYRFIGQF